jgi:hypothetical protein
MFFRSPVGRLISFLFSLGIAAIIYFAVIKDKVDNAKDSSSNGDPTQVGGDSLYKRANFTKALTAVRSKIGGDSELLKVQVVPTQAEFQVKKGERADGYRYTAKGGDLQKVKVEIVGGGTIEGLQYPFRAIDPGVTENLDRAVRERKGLHPTTMTLEKGPVGARLAWTISAEGNGRTGLAFKARPDGSGLADPAKFAGAGAKPGGSAVTKAQKQQQCILKAGSDATRSQACLK